MSPESSTPTETGSTVDRLFSGGGEMGTLVRATNWAHTPLGAVETWPQSLRTTLSTCLSSRFPILVWWGPEMVMLYNDAYIPMLGAKHPRALGQPGRECWSEIWNIIGPMLDGVIARGDSTWSEDQMLPLARHGYVEECYFTFSYSPVRDETGGIGGIFTAVTETTMRVLQERRLLTLRDLAAHAAGATTESQAWREALEPLAQNDCDVPFALLFAMSDPLSTPLLVGSTPDAWGHALQPTTLASIRSAESWPWREALDTSRGIVVRDVSARFGELVGKKWPEPVKTAVALPIARTRGGSAYGILVVGVNPRHALNDAYRDFLRLVADHIGAAVANSRAYEEERRRAEALAELDRAKTTFFANISHEFRTPLTLMLGPVDDGLADTAHPLPPEQRERQELVRRNGLRLQKLVNTLLDFARMEAGRAQASFVPTDLCALTVNLASSFQAAIENAGLKLLVDCDELPEPVYVDPAMWEKIVLNLLSNAFKFTFQGTIRIALGWTGHGVELRVEDTGTGIPSEEQPRIFERFHQVDGAHGRSNEGSGIGLALVKELIALHGGKIEVASTLGAGTTFSVTVPSGSAHLPKDRIGKKTCTLAPTGIGAEAFLAESVQWSGAPAPAPALPPPAPAMTHAPSVEPGARILVVDDNADMRGYLEKLLSARWTVETAGDGVQALAQAEAHPPDLVLSDVMMPAMDGLALLRALRRDERTRTIPVILLSARAGEEATVQGLQSGTDEYLVKPFSANVLYARVQAQLTVSRLRREAAEQATRAREEALATVSHDLRSPLSTIEIAAGVLERRLGRELPEVTWRKQTDVIHRSVSRMNQLVGDLLDSASIEAGSLSIHPEPFAVADLIREVCEAFEPQAMDKGINFSTEVDEGLPTVSLDHSRIVQALGNLISNALKFTAQGGAITLSARGDPNGICFSVSDTGVGLPSEAVPHLFERHWYSPQPGRQGHGLGLSIAKGIVAAHGGTVRAQSELGRGSTFSLSIPFAP